MSDKLLYSADPFGHVTDTDIKAVLSAFRHRRFDPHYAADAESARAIVRKLIPPGSKVGTGDSTTARQLGVVEDLQKNGVTVYFAHDKNIPYTETAKHRDLSYSSDCGFFLTGTNAVTLDGRLVNVDASGNRVGGMFYGHGQTVLLIGKNKIVKDLDAAFGRIRGQIAPQHLKIRSTDLGGKAFKAGCVKTGVCVDCQGENRICNVFTIIEGKPSRTQIHIVLVDLDLGLGWDESWPAERIGAIVESYKEFVWVPPKDLAW
ncbi:lactate utilization protein [Sporomusa sp.]|uniref:lactate utilization protein n=1 Tax=Sporomusa sp. TaxID=2078658 RepID=UPI002B91F519|nr:lactate utilization protein [Sporomusa sp.]HWR08315.1 lactate utilization protein [Sporomusa sp.]